MSVACLGRVPDGWPLRRIIRVPGNVKVTIDEGHQLPEGPASPALRAGIVRQASLCCVLIAAVSSAAVAMSAWSLRENILSALVAVLAVMVGLLLLRHRLTEQRLAASGMNHLAEELNTFSVKTCAHYDVN